MASTRATALLALIQSYQQEPTDYDEGEEEDPRPYVSGKIEPDPWVCITVNYSRDHGEEKTFFLPRFETAKAAQARATEYVLDTMWPEYPVAVVNLDTGETFKPDWTTLQWWKTEAAS